MRFDNLISMSKSDKLRSLIRKRKKAITITLDPDIVEDLDQIETPEWIQESLGIEKLSRSEKVNFILLYCWNVSANDEDDGTIMDDIFREEIEEEEEEEED